MPLASWVDIDKSCSGTIASCKRMSEFFEKSQFQDQSCMTRNLSSLHPSMWLTYRKGTAIILQKWVVIETGTYIIGACLPTLRILGVNWFSWARSLHCPSSQKMPTLDRANPQGVFNNSQLDDSKNRLTSMGKSYNENTITACTPVSGHWSDPESNKIMMKGIKVRQDYDVEFGETAPLGHR